MKFTTKAFAAGLILIGGIAIAGEATEPNAKARQDLMDGMGGAMKVLGGMAGGEAAFDAAAAGTAVQALIDHSGKIGEVFQTQSEDPASKAKPEIWTNWDDFAAKAKALNDAAMAIDASSLDGIKAGMGGVGGACKGCHETYKAS